MIRSKLFSILSSFSIEELKDFRKYLTGLYGGKKELGKIFRYVQKYYPEFNSPKLDKKIAFHKIFGADKDYNYHKLMEGLSELNKIAKEFIIWRKMKKDSFERNWVLLNYYRERNLERLHGLTYKKLEETQIKKGFWGYFEKFKLHYAAYFSAFGNDIVGLGGELTRSIKFLDLFIVGAKLKLGNEAKARELVLRESHQHRFIDVIQQQIPEFQEYEYLKLQHLAFLLKVNPSKESFNNLKSFFYGNWKALPYLESYTILTALMNFTIREKNKGDKKIELITFELMKFGDFNNLFLELGNISSYKFHNIINTGCNLNEFRWVEAFIKKWNDFLPQKERVDGTNLGYGYLFFAQKEYNQVISTLGEVEFSNPIIAIRAKPLLLMSYYETNAGFEFIFSNCRAFEHFLRRNKRYFSEGNHQSHLNYLLFLKRIVQKNYSYSKILFEIKNQKKCIYKQWLIEKVEK